MRNLWLIFAQTVTASLAILFAIQVVNPNLFNFMHLGNTQSVTIKQADSSAYAKVNVQNTYSHAVKKAMPSVVNIFTSKKAVNPHQQFLDDPLFKHFFGDQQEDQEKPETSLGSGVIVNEQGFILTNDHVVNAADEIKVAMGDGRTMNARIVGTDPETDLAVLKIDALKLPAITFAADDSSSVGDVVLAIGNPFGVGQTVTQGIISALGRNHLGINTFENFIQTDASINPGNSGGALIDTQGNLLGINSAIYSRSGGSMGIGFAIPSKLAKQVLEQIILTGGVTRGWIGIEAQDITPELAESFKLNEVKGSLIAGILKGSPADKAGIRPGDILLEIGGHVVEDSAGMLNIIADLKPSEQTTLKIERNQKKLDIKVTVGKRPRTERVAELE